MHWATRGTIWAPLQRNCLRMVRAGVALARRDLSIDAPDVQVPETRPRTTRFHFLEFIMSAAALIVSGTSIAVALHHGEIMEKLVAANSLPYAQVVSGNASFRPDGTMERRWYLQMRNLGVGPADVTDVQLSVDGHPVHDLRQWLSACCATDDEARELVAALEGETVVNNLPRHFIPAGEEVTLFSIPLTESTQPYWDRMGNLFGRTAIEVCYCSVFGECWSTNVSGARHEVDACHPSEHRFTP